MASAIRTRQGLKLFVIVYLVNLIPELLEPTLSSFILAIDTNGTSLPYGEIMTGLVFSIITVVTYCYLLIKAPSIALGLITGTPTMETVGSHFVTMMGAKSIGVAAAGIGAAVAAVTGSIGGIFGRIFGRTGRPKQETTTSTPTTLPEVNTTKHRRVDG